MRLLLALALLLTGCATQDIDPDKASYFMVSQGDVSLIYKFFAGGVDYCKVTQSNLMKTGYIVELSYDGDKCQVTATAQNQ